MLIGRSVPAPDALAEARPTEREIRKPLIRRLEFPPPTGREAEMRAIIALRVLDEEADRATGHAGGARVASHHQHLGSSILVEIDLLFRAVDRPAIRGLESGSIGGDGESQLLDD